MAADSCSRDASLPVSYDVVSKIWRSRRWSVDTNLVVLRASEVDQIDFSS